LIDISIKTVLPKSGNSYNEQLIDCLNQFKLFFINNIISISSPIQYDAYKYSKDVLVGKFKYK